MYKRGFTLIELITVISVISVLAVVLIVLVNPLGQFQKTWDGERKSDLFQIQKSLEAYYADHGSYPSSAGNIINDANGAHNFGSSGWSYMDVIPNDPSAPTKKYVYYSPADGQSYGLYASLDRGNQDSQVCNSGNACTTLFNAIGNNANTACGGVCNYGVSSPNASP